MAKLVYHCEDGETSTLSGSPVPAGYVLSTCRVGKGGWVEVADSWEQEKIAYEESHPVTPMDELALIGVTPEAVLASVGFGFGFGFGTICMFWYIGYVTGIGKKAINQA